MFRIINHLQDDQGRTVREYRQTKQREGPEHDIAQNVLYILKQSTQTKKTKAKEKTL